MPEPSFAIVHPELIKEWHPTKNGSLTPYKVTPFSDKIIWWKCPKGDDHEWSAAVKTRSNGSGCGVCANRVVVKSNCLATLNPTLANQWHPLKNGDLTPGDVVPGSYKIVWWKCPKGDDHEWQSAVEWRNNGNGCPICSNRKVVHSNCLATLNPELAREWHPTKNGELTPDLVTTSSGKKVWWKCSKGNDHEWQASVADRNGGHGCAVCASRTVVNSNCLATLNPALASEWHPTKNGVLTPDMVTGSSGKKVWWRCPKGDDHEWQAVIANRNKGIGCPICSNQKVARSTSLGSSNSELLSEWHPTKNRNLTPYDVLPSANVKIWWKCTKGDDHEWQAKLNNRANGRGCPICSGHKVVKSNCLATRHPELAEQWHPSKNGTLTPRDVAPGYGKRVWWRCPKGDDHEWQATPNHRTSGTGCPKCNPAYSIPELRIFSELKAIFPRTQHRVIIQKCEVDIFIPDVNFGIEFDGVYWHHNKHDKDTEKNLSLSSIISLIRVREEGLPLLSANDIRVKKRDINISTVKNILTVVLKSRTDIASEFRIKINKYMETNSWIASDYFDKLFSQRKHVAFEKSLSFLFPEIAKEWHPTRNNHLLPEHFTHGSGRKIWWLGGCKHEWADSILHRTGGRGCPKCRYKKAKRTRLKSIEKKRAEIPETQLSLGFR